MKKNAILIVLLLLALCLLCSCEKTYDQKKDDILETYEEYGKDEAMLKVVQYFPTDKFYDIALDFALQLGEMDKLKNPNNICDDIVIESAPEETKYGYGVKITNNTDKTFQAIWFNVYVHENGKQTDMPLQGFWSKETARTNKPLKPGESTIASIYNKDEDQEFIYAKAFKIFKE